jgi:predicted DNA-binding protein (MmcQ/YjbR family)
MLDVLALKAYCLRRKGAAESYPFGPDAAVYKVFDKMFALIPDDPPARISLKCDPGWAQILRETYPAIAPGYHLNKRHWNTVTVDGTVPDDEIREMIRHSYDLVVKGLTRAARDELAALPDAD